MEIRSTAIRTAVVAVTALTFAVASISPAIADETPNAEQVADIAATAAEAIDQAVEPVDLVVSGGGFTTEAQDVTIPLNPAAVIEAGPIVYGLPFEAELGVGEETDSGAIAYPADDGLTSLTVTVGEGVIQQVLVIDSSEASHNYSFAIDPRLTLVPTADGGVDLTALDEAGSQVVVARVAAPWAVDANGAPVPTSFTSDGNMLIQTVDFTAETDFPVVADPTISNLWWGIAVKYNRAETRQLAAAATGGATISGAASLACGAAGPWKSICVALVLLKGWQLFGVVIQANAEGRCAQLNFPRILPGPITMHFTKVTC